MAIHRVLLSNRPVVEIYRDPIEDVENQFLSELKPHGTPIVPLSNAQLPARTNKTGTQEQALYLVALLLSLIGLTILRLVFPPLKFWTDLLALAAYAAIPGLLIFIFLQRQRNGATHDERGNRAQGFVRFIACATFAAFSLFTLNIVLEKKTTGGIFRNCVGKVHRVTKTLSLTFFSRSCSRPGSGIQGEYQYKGIARRLQSCCSWIHDDKSLLA